MKLVRRLSVVTAIATLGLVALGGVVRATGSGLGCPDWPRCHGRLIPPLEFHALIEYSHRLLASIVVILVIATAWAAWRRARGTPQVLRPAVLAIGVVLLQAGLGAVVVAEELAPLPNTLHFATAMLLVATVVTTAANAVLGRAAPGDGPRGAPGMRRLLWWALGVTAGALLAGVYMRGSGSSLAFLDWPLMDGRAIPELRTEAAWAAFLHRAIAALAVVLIVGIAVRARELAPRLRWLAWTAAGLVLLQSGLGAATVFTRLDALPVAGHILGSSLTWASIVALVAGTRPVRHAEAVEESDRPGARQVAGAYLQLMKPDIIVLLLVTTVPTMILAAGGFPPVGLVAATLLGGTLAAGGANALNHYLDRDIDEVMDRTRARPIPAHRVEPDDAKSFGILLSGLSFAWLALTVNLLSAALALSAILFYVFVYTAWMKRSTPQNIVIGGAAGAVPALVGWAAVTGSLALPAWVLFALIFFWTPPHFWALSMKYADDYQAAGVPMLVVLHGSADTATHILLYSIQTVAVSLLLFPA
ncbi:MAG TPA: heme o synthase, partial [Actinomycetota bacterium]